MKIVEYFNEQLVSGKQMMNGITMITDFFCYTVMNDAYWSWMLLSYAYWICLGMFQGGLHQVRSDTSLHETVQLNHGLHSERQTTLALSMFPDSEIHRHIDMCIFSWSGNTPNPFSYILNMTITTDISN